MAGASAGACLYTAMQLSIRPPLLRNAIHRSKTLLTNKITDGGNDVSKSKFGKKSIPTYTSPPTMTFLQIMWPNWLKYPKVCTRYAEALDKGHP
jgi:hypothetical protein